jgi:hypothetical protein
MIGYYHRIKDVFKRIFLFLFERIDERVDDLGRLDRLGSTHLSRK